MTARRLFFTMLLAFVMSVLLPPIYAQDNKVIGKSTLDKESSELVGKWEIYETKEPGRPYMESYKGRPFVTKGANAFTLILQYNNDGTFRRTARIGNSETVEEGIWRLSGHELRHRRKGASQDEIMYIRFSDNNHYTSTEVYEDTPDPGLFAKFRRIN